MADDTVSLEAFAASLPPNLLAVHRTIAGPVLLGATIPAGADAKTVVSAFGVLFRSWAASHRDKLPWVSSEEVDGKLEIQLRESFLIDG